MIPQNIGPEHILLALRELDAEASSVGQFFRGNHYHCLVENGRHYPTWQVISLANRLANDFDLPYDFRSYMEINAFLQSRGFSVVLCPGGSFRRLLVINLTLAGMTTFVAGLVEIVRAQSWGGLLMILGALLVLLALESNARLARGH